MTRSPHPRRLLAAAALCLLAFGACGSEEEPDDAKDATTETTASEGSGEGAAGKGAGAAVEGDAVAIEDFQYEPANLKVKPGTKVTFTNKDEFAHTVTAKDESYDSGNMGKDAVFEHTYDEPGTYDYFCRIHVYMTATVTVA